MSFIEHSALDADNTVPFLPALTVVGVFALFKLQIVRFCQRELVVNLPTVCRSVLNLSIGAPQQWFIRRCKQS